MKTRCGICKEHLNTALVHSAMLGSNAVHQHCLEAYRIKAVLAIGIGVIAMSIVIALVAQFGGSP